MQSRKYYNKQILRIEPGEEIRESLNIFCKGKKIRLGSVTGTGLVSRAVISSFDPEMPECCKQELAGDYKMDPLCGNIINNGQLVFYLSVILTDAQNNTISGILDSAIASTYCDIIIDPLEMELEKISDDGIDQGSLSS